MRKKIGQPWRPDIGIMSRMHLHVLRVAGCLGASYSEIDSECRAFGVGLEYLSESECGAVLKVLNNRYRPLVAEKLSDHNRPVSWSPVSKNKNLKPKRVTLYEAWRPGYPILSDGGSCYGTRIIQYVIEYTGIKGSDIRGASRLSLIVEARRLAMWLLRYLTNMSFGSIGALLNRDHATVMHHCKKMNEEGGAKHLSWCRDYIQ